MTRSGSCLSSDLDFVLSEERESLHRSHLRRHRGLRLEQVRDGRENEDEPSGGKRRAEGI